MSEYCSCCKDEVEWFVVHVDKTGEFRRSAESDVWDLPAMVYPHLPIEVKKDFHWQERYDDNFNRLADLVVLARNLYPVPEVDEARLQMPNPLDSFSVKKLNAITQQHKETGVTPTYKHRLPF